MFKKKIAAALIALFFFTPLMADEVALNPDHPEQYVVVKGDTLWDISATFLKDPWLWPEIWYVNQQIANPHLIYPGDVISLVYIDGKPRLQVTRGEGGGEGKLVPKVREVPLDQAIPTIPLDAINQFLSQPRIVDEEMLKTMPYVVSIAEGRVMAGTDDKIYGKGTDPNGPDGYTLFKKGDAFIDPDSKDGEIIGYEAIYLGDAKITKKGDPATLIITDSVRETSVGNYLLPAEDRVVQTDYQPHPPAQDVNGRIIHVYNGVKYIGQYSIIALNRGSNHGLDEGTVLAVYQEGAMVDDPRNEGEKVQLPDERAGEVLVFRTYPKVSFALVMRATREMRVLDMVRTP